MRDRRIGRALLATVTLGAVSLGIGCAKPVLSAEDDRSQYARYDQSRNQAAPPFLEDEFGRRQPNLRGRLLPRD